MAAKKRKDRKLDGDALRYNFGRDVLPGEHCFRERLDLGGSRHGPLLNDPSFRCHIHFSAHGTQQRGVITLLTISPVYL